MPPHIKHMYKIYCLVRPDDSKPFYIGQTKRDVSKRLQEHLVYLTADAKSKIIKQLKQIGQNPNILILEESFCTSNEAAIAELFWIEIFRVRGIPLTNNGLFFGGKLHKIDKTKYEEKDPYPVWQNPDNSIKTGLNNKLINHGEPWTELEDIKVSTAYQYGVSIEDIAIEHQRSVGGISSRLTKLGLIK